MNLLCVILICFGALVAMATPGRQSLIEEDLLASSPLFQELIDRIDMLERQGVKQAHEIQSLKTEMSKQRGYMKKLQSQIYAKDMEIRKLFSKVIKSSEDENLRTDGRKEISDSKTTSVLKGTPEKEKIQMVKRIQPHDTVLVAFTASLTHNVVHIESNRTIVFDHVITNVGNAYNPEQGVFIAPVTGIYVFATTVVSDFNDSSIVFMTVNDKTQTILYTRDEIHHTVSQTILFELNEGDVVAIKARPDESICGVYPQSFTTFSGFLLQQTYSSIGGTHVIG